jgi:hypothetical protein
MTQDQVPTLDTSVPHSARVWNYWLGGKDNFAADRAAGDRVREVFPAIVDNARAQRAFLGRAVRHLAADRGIRQFLDLGTGLPTADNTHEIAQSVAPEARVVYVDNDPLVLVHARALLASSPEGVTDYVDADVRDTDLILGEARRVLDFDRPVAVIMLGILGNIPDYDDAGPSRSPPISRGSSSKNPAWSPRPSGGTSPTATRSTATAGSRARSDGQKAPLACGRSFLISGVASQCSTILPFSTR